MMTPLTISCFIHFFWLFFGSVMLHFILSRILVFAKGVVDAEENITAGSVGEARTQGDEPPSFLQGAKD